jgi:hypothetical protein
LIPSSLNSSNCALRPQASTASVPSDDEITSDVFRWSAILRQRLTILTDQERQDLIGTLLNEVVIYDEHIRISGEIPRPPGSAGSIVPTPSSLHGHNPASYSFEFLLPLAAGRRVRSAIADNIRHPVYGSRWSAPWLPTSAAITEGKGFEPSDAVEQKVSEDKKTDSFFGKTVNTDILIRHQA